MLTLDRPEAKRAIGLSLRANFSWTFVGNVVYAGSQWGMLTVLAKLGSPEMVGRFALGLAITAPVIILAHLCLRAVQATDAKREYLFGDYLGLRLITTPLALLVIAGVIFVAGYRWQTALAILIMGLAKAFESVSDVFYGLFQQYERMDYIAKSRMIKGPLSLAALGVGIHLTGNLIWGVVGLMAAWAITLLSYDIHNGVLLLKASSHMPAGAMPEEPNVTVALQPRWAIGTLSKLAWLALPLGLTMMLISLNTNIPRYFIERLWGERELGIFAATAYLMIAGRTIVDALGQSASPRLAKYYAAGDIAAFRTLLLKLVGIGVLLGSAGVLVALVAGRQILTLLYRPEYAEHADLFLWLMLAAAIGYVDSFLGYGLTAARYFKIQPFIFGVSAVVTATLCVLLVPEHGVLGAALALVIVHCARTTMMFVGNVYAIHALSTIKNALSQRV
jgi:O-antigen/teichoic acid export membrane protein